MNQTSIYDIKKYNILVVSHSDLTDQHVFLRIRCPSSDFLLDSGPLQFDSCRANAVDRGLNRRKSLC